MTDYSRQHAILDQFIESDEHRANARTNLQTYFAGGYTGAQFNSFREAENLDRDRNRFTWDDVIAVKMLSVDIPTKTCSHLFNDGDGEIQRLLTRVKATPLHAAPSDPLADGGPADKLWHHLVGFKGVGWVTAAKLIARKRSHAVPIYDDVTKSVLGAPKSFWRCMSTYLRDTPESVNRVAHWRRLGDETDSDSLISVLRTIDVVLWTHGKASARSEAGLVAAPLMTR